MVLGKSGPFLCGKPSRGSPFPTLPKGRELVLAVFKAVWRFSFPLGKAGMVLVAGEVSMMRERGGWYMVEMYASSSNSV